MHFGYKLDHTFVTFKENTRLAKGSYRSPSTRTANQPAADKIRTSTLIDAGLDIFAVETPGFRNPDVKQRKDRIR